MAERGVMTMPKKKKRGPGTVERVSVALIAVAMLAVSFGAGWYFGVQSTRTMCPRGW